MFNKDKTNNALKVFYYGFIVPSLVYLSLFNVYYFFSEPQIFVYQKFTPCYGDDCPELPIMADGVSILGISVSDPFPIPLLNDEEFAEKQSFVRNINVYSLISFGLILFGLVYTRWEDLKDAFTETEINIGKEE